MTRAFRALKAAGKRLACRAREFWAAEQGATIIEYGLIVSLIFLAIVGAVQQFAVSTNDMYSDIESALQN